MLEIISGTRVFGNFEPERFQSQLTPFIENASAFGEAAIISQKAYPNLDELLSFVRPGVRVRLSDTVGAESPADMCNQIILAGADLEAQYFAVISSDLAEYIPLCFPPMIEKLQSDQSLTSVGVAIQGVHNFALLNEVEAQGLSAVTPDNYATIFHNNAFAIHRLYPEVGEGKPLTVDERLFPRITDQGKLGSVEIDGQTIPIGGNEEIALALQLLKRGRSISTLLLAGSSSIVRDPDKELSSVDAKILRRPFVARAYQEYYGVSDSEVSDYLAQHYNIAFS